MGEKWKFAALSYHTNPMLFPLNHPFTPTLFPHLIRKNLHFGSKTLLARILSLREMSKMFYHAEKVYYSINGRSAEGENTNRTTILECISMYFSIFVDHTLVHYEVRGRSPTKRYVECMNMKQARLYFLNWPQIYLLYNFLALLKDSLIFVDCL